MVHIMLQPVRPGDGSRSERTRMLFVGRERELRDLHAALETMLARSGQIVVLTGEPGIGKTHLIEEFVTVGMPCDVCVGWGHCDEWEGTPAYWPWIQILSELISKLDANLLQSLRGVDMSSLLRILPDFLPDLQLSPVEPREARFELFRAATELLRQAAALRPLVLVIDDLQWADAASLELTQFVARALRDARVLLIVAYRQHEVGRDTLLADTLASLTRERGHLRLALHGLSRSEVSSYVAHSMQTVPGQSLTDAVYDATGGNALFMREVVRLLLAEDTSDRSDVSLLVPESVRDLVRQRVRGLTSDCRDQLGIASVIGREFSLTVLAGVAGRSITQVMHDIEPSVEAGLVDVLDTGWYRFIHALVQATLYEDLSSEMRMAAHQSVGETLERLTGESVSRDAELAHHFGKATPLGTTEKAFAYALKAADAALSRFAWDTAITHYRMALRALDFLSEQNLREQCDVLVLMGEAQTRAGEGREDAMLSGTAPAAMQTFRRAIEISRTSHLPEHFARAVLGLTGPDLSVPQSRAEGVALMREGLAALPTCDSPLRARLLARLAADSTRLWSVGDLELDLESTDQVHQHADEAVEMARRIGEVRTLTFTLLARQLMGEGLGHGLGSLDDTDEVLAVALETGDVRFIERAYWHKYFVTLSAGQINVAERILTAVEQLGAHRWFPLSQHLMLTARAGRALRCGHFDDVETFLTRAESIWPSTAMGLFQLGTLRWEQNRIGEIAAQLRHRREYLPNASLMHAYQIVLHLETGAVLDARKEFDSIATAGFADIPRGLQWLRTMTWLAAVAARLGDVDRAGAICDLLVPYAHVNVVQPKSDHAGGSVSYYLGLLATTLERWDLAESHFQYACERNQQWMNWPYLAHTQHAWADMLVRRGHENDRQHALELNQLALQSAEEMRMVRLVSHARTLREQMMSAHPTGQSTNDDYGLSAREVDVLHLMVDGRTNREIAEMLYISPRTVGSHVSNILGKLGVRTRTEAVSLVVRMSLLVALDERKA
jgi:DNA-binding CsgD family transcriptional regulator/tetratricopeptide (TPR) repeat protein